MNSLSQTVARSFTGEVHLEGQPVLVSLGFAEGRVHLRLGGEPVGSWALDEVQFQPIDEGAYELHADGDHIDFHPHQGTAFARFLESVEDTPDGVGFEEPDIAAEDYTQGEVPGIVSALVPPPAPVSVAAPTVSSPAQEAPPPKAPVDLPEIEVAEPEAKAAEPVTAPDPVLRRPVDPDPSPWEPPSARSESPGEPFAWEPRTPAEPTEWTPSVDGQAVGEIDGYAEAAEDEEASPALVWEDPDEFFAAGYSGPTEVEAPSFFRSAFTVEEPAPPTEPSLTEESEPAAPERFTSNGDGNGGTFATRFRPAHDATSNGVETPLTGLDTVAPDIAELADATDYSPPPTEPPPPPVGDQPDRTPTADHEIPPTAVIEEEPPTIAEQAETEAGEVDSGRSGVVGRFAARLASSSRTPTPPPTETAVFSPTDDETPEAIDDAENMRQWVVVVIGGVAAVVLLAIVVLGLTSIFSSDDPEIADTTVTTAAPVAEPAAPETTTSTTVRVVPASSVGEQTDTFITEWNTLARSYAFNLAIEQTSVPISVQVTETIHLSYTTGGPLTLAMTPTGTGTDRDLLVAMGMAVAWADPELGPEERKGLMAEMGIDVDNPDLSQVGGEVETEAATYRASVAGEILLLEVSRKG